MTPPVGMNVFVIDLIVPDISLLTIFRGVAPFILTDLLCLALLVAFPGWSWSCRRRWAESAHTASVLVAPTCEVLHIPVTQALLNVRQVKRPRGGPDRLDDRLHRHRRLPANERSVSPAELAGAVSTGAG